ncbi:MAG: ATP-binding protein [bacterium]
MTETDTYSLPKPPLRGSAEARRRRRETLLIVLIAAVSGGMFVAIRSALRGDLRVPGQSWIYLSLLINANVVLILLMLFLLIRNVVKLVVERRKGVLGARLRSKLVVAFVALSLFPTVVLFVSAVQVVSRSLDEWFDAKVEESLESALEVAQVFYKDKVADASTFAERIAGQIAARRLATPERANELAALLAEAADDYRVTSVEALDARGAALARGDASGAPRFAPTDPAASFVQSAFRGSPDASVLTIRGALRPATGERGELIRAAAPMRASGSSAPAGVVVVTRWVPESLEQGVKTVRANFEQYRQIVVGRKPIRQSYLAVFIALTLLSIFAATWFGFYLSRTLTGPISQLARATRRVTAGDLDVHIERSTDDELGTLVTDFNQMITELRESRAALDERRRYTETILKNVAAGVVSLDGRGRITTINKSAERLLGVRASESLRHRYRSILPAEHREVFRGLVRELGRAKTDTIERQIQLTIEDRTVTLLASVTLLRDEEREFLGLLFVFEDLTQLLKAQRMAAWREVARRIAHEIKNPLTPIQLAAQRIQHRYENVVGADREILTECTSTIVSQVEGLKKLVSEFSDFARMPASNPSPNSLNDIVEEALALYDGSHDKIRFTRTLDPDVPIFNLDREQIKRVIINLIDNAIRALDGAVGQVDVVTHYNRLLDLARLEISDTGEGIPPEIRPRLFEPYFSTRRGGTGLGLAIVSTIVADHHGYIRLRDRKPHGTTFIVELPIRI